ncbi:glutathione transferase family protein [Acanthamoeba castellanii str. Neff]|uniref:Glutathione transferase family protein n=1 Tax=Acanthamoeba castellanii (strain ATCC 30010 / Neff) TaxID=1257118 RepID=L8GFR3_ACACF|nr:glutathione transferase family protein [Acanthamoeba castellanii str. Neff]ELR11689.1 glutathione transferase family protein [Acanthamoeba castellanii str. Neff]
MAQSDSKLTLYTNPICPFAHRALLTATEKGLSSRPSSSLLAVNPRGTVPTLVHGEHTIHESLLITEYLDDAFFNASPRLLPSDPYQRYASRFIVDQFGSQVIPALYQLLRNQDRSQDDKIKEEITKKLKALLDLYSAQAGEGPYFLGQHISLADVAILPFIGRFAISLPHYRDFDVLAVDERLKKWHDAFGYAKYANPTQ